MNLRSLVCALYILLGLLIASVTYLSTYHGPESIRFFGWILFLIGILYQIFPNLNEYLRSFANAHSNEEDKENIKK
jgi:hypothetical protein